MFKRPTPPPPRSIPRDTWYEMYSAARRLARTDTAHHNDPYKEDRGKNMAWRIVWDTVRSIHPAMHGAIWCKPSNDVIYPISSYRWAISHNSTQFGAIRRFNKYQHEIRKIRAAHAKAIGDSQ